jgi:predicted enzyme related to lactoylglutathione lyase
MKIKLVSIPVNDPVAAHKFYTETLDFVSIMFMPEGQLAIVASPEDPAGTTLLLEPNAHPISKTFQEGVYKLNLPIIVFGVEDIKAEYEKLKSRGVVFRKEPTTTQWGHEAIFEDTFGNLIQIHQA